MAYGLSKRSTDEAKNKIAREGFYLGALGIATALVGLGGILVVAGLRFGLGLHSIREFGELVRGGPLIYLKKPTVKPLGFYGCKQRLYTTLQYSRGNTASQADLDWM